MSQALCNLDENGAVTSCIELQEAAVLWGPTVGDLEEGFGLVVAAYIAGFSLAALVRAIMNKG